MDSISCRDGKGTIYTITNYRQTALESRNLWTGKSIDPDGWVRTVLKHFESDEMGSVMALDCVSNWPLLLQGSGRVQLCGRTLHSLYVFDEKSTSECLRDIEGGYDQEVVVVQFLRICYFSSTTPAEGLSRLTNDVRYLYEMGIWRRDLDPCMKYLHDRLCRGNVLNDCVQWMSWMPIHPDLAHAVFEYGRWLMAVSKGDSYKSMDAFVEMTLCSLYIESEKEWSVVERCRQLCGLPWRRRSVRNSVEVRYGQTKWHWDWRNTHLVYGGKTYHERLDERVLWVSVWLVHMANGIFSPRDGPMHLLAMVANAMH